MTFARILALGLALTFGVAVGITSYDFGYAAEPGAVGEPKSEPIAPKPPVPIKPEAPTKIIVPIQPAPTVKAPIETNPTVKAPIEINPTLNGAPPSTSPAKTAVPGIKCDVYQMAKDCVDARAAIAPVSCNTAGSVPSSTPGTCVSGADADTCVDVASGACP
jgi:hypothetical protein